MSTSPSNQRPTAPVFALAEKGSTAAESLDVYLHLDALEEMLEVIQRHDRYEAGGVLAGVSGHDASGPYLLVRRALHAHQARRERLALTFTAEVWEELWAAHARQCPDLAIVGWYHTHPGLGVFLSEPDQFIHRHFFGAGHQIALVYDPDDFRWGVFYWEEDALRAARGLYLYAEADRSYPALLRALHEVAPEGIILHDSDG
jgi:proteasome lid subunit RPN8/RPN11